ncbi:MAG: carbohydrate kinase [Ferruginibacter sp.]|nr:carbohydrate kinase [Ferruginibacter sp.]
MNTVDFDKLFKNINQLKVGVIGDIMLDTYWWGKVDRISPEAPVPVVAVTKREQRIGGAGNVALNIVGLGASVSVISVLGDDDDGKLLTGLLEDNKIGTKYLAPSAARITTNKIRIISRNQHMMRLDAEITKMLSAEDERLLLNGFKKYLAEAKPDIVILEDYNKGVLTETAITSIIALCRENNVLTAVDPKRKNFFAYRYADIFKPNLHEAKEGLNIIGDEVSQTSLSKIHEALHAQLHHNISFITLSEKGVYYREGNNEQLISTHIRSIADVSGAGDTVIAVASLVYAASKDVQLMAEMANIAGGLVCEEVGTVAINKEKFLAECKFLLAAP